MPHGRPSGPICLCVRPHALAFDAEGRENSVTAVVREVTWMGDLDSIDVEIAGVPARMICTPMREPPQQGAQVTLHFATDDATLIPEDTG